METIGLHEPVTYNEPMPIEPHAETLYSATDAAERMGITRQRLNRLINEGRIKAIRDGRHWYIPESEIGRVTPSTKKIGRPRKIKYQRKAKE